MLLPSTTTLPPKPRVILGCMTFGPPGSEPKGARITSLSTYNACLAHLSSNGYSELDTARIYIDGAQESFTARTSFRDQAFSIATKCYPSQPGMHAPARLRASLETSLKELELPCVDIFYLHAPDRSVPFEETLQCCDEMFREGKFVTLGLSNFAAWEVAEVVNIARERGWVQPRVYQAMYNAVTRAIESELVPCCRKYGLDIVVYNPLAGGLFSGKYSAASLASTPDSGRFSTTNARQGSMYRDRYFRGQTLEALGMIEPVVKEHGLTLVETALRWVVHHSILDIAGRERNETNAKSAESGEKSEKSKRTANDGIIIGVSSLEQLESNTRDLEKGPLPDAVVEVLDRAWMSIGGSCPSYWR